MLMILNELVHSFQSKQNISYTCSKKTYSSSGQCLCKKSKILIVVPHLSKLKLFVHKVTAGKETSLIGWESVPTTVILGLSIHTERWYLCIHKPNKITNDEICKFCTSASKGLKVIVEN